MRSGGAYSGWRRRAHAEGFRKVQPVRPSGVAPSDPGASGPGEARLLASGVLIQQLAQVSGLLVLLAIVTLLARRLTVAELGAYGLVASLSGYLLVFRNSVASSAVRAMAIAAPGEERSRTFTAAAALYALVGLVTGLLLALAAIAIAAAILEGELATDARRGRHRARRGHRRRHRLHRLARRAAGRAAVRALAASPRSRAWRPTSC